MENSKWELLAVTGTKSNSQFSSNRFRFTYFIRNTISGKFHQYFLNMVNTTSINTKCHAYPKCKAKLSLKIGNSN